MTSMDRELQNNTCKEEKELIESIISQTKNGNIDNISRTETYFSFYKDHPDIIWSFLASMVSRNAGWNMCDLQGEWFPQVIPPEVRKRLFLTYERANWLIYHDAFPQLLLYHYSTKINKPMFHLLKKFHVSTFMEKEWNHYWTYRDTKRLMIAQIINEQNVIQQPVIQHPVYKEKVFQSLLFNFQDWFHYSSVLFPTCHGELYGASVHGFKSVHKRIDLGKRLADILFNQELFPEFFEFANTTPHTGSRDDYEQFLLRGSTGSTPALRSIYPIIDHHIHEFYDWSHGKIIRRKWKKPRVRHRHPIKITKWYIKKQKKLHLAIMIKTIFSHKKSKG